MRGAGPAIVLIHGTTATIAGSFSSVIPLLARDHTVIQMVIEGIRTASPATVPIEFRAEYERVAPHPDAWPTHIAKIRTLWMDWKGFSPDAIRGIRAPALVMAGDADAVRPEHTLALFHCWSFN